MKWYRKLHWQILTALVVGILFGILAVTFGWSGFAKNWISPFGTVFINLLKFVAVPLVLTSLIIGVASLSDLKRLSSMGGKTIGIYLGTTAVAITIGLLVVNVIKPGKQVPQSMRDQLMADYRGEADTRSSAAETVKQRGPLEPFIEAVPDNFFGAAADNRNMLQMVFAAILIGVAVIQVPREKTKPFIDVVDALMDIVIRLVELIMLAAPIGVFALITDAITTLARDNPGQVFDLLRGLGVYFLAVVAGLLLHVIVVYSGMVRFFTPFKLRRYIAAVGPAQLLAFSTSSSGATLPVTMEQCKRKLGVSEEAASFVLPLGATINMDGTALYQAVAAVFIAQTYSMDLNLAQQLTIVTTALLASIGTAAVPGAGIVMLVIILQAVEVPAEGIALILGVDRPLDMLRTAVNVTGDTVVTSVVARSEGQLNPPADAFA
ncbi:MAG TPA: dicarboxylate/amino acid:cation symporter [Verrucomicrobiales bacterium]|nr:dicarboxylate/amino acid:cation symporter [Verrucomicrobiales bacterium]